MTVKLGVFEKVAIVLWVMLAALIIYHALDTPAKPTPNERPTCCTLLTQQITSLEERLDLKIDQLRASVEEDTRRIKRDLKTLEARVKKLEAAKKKPAKHDRKPCK